MFFRRLLCIWVTISFLGSMVIAPQRAYAQGLLNLPEPGTMVSLSSAYAPVLIKGLKIDPSNPLAFDFIVAAGNSQLTAPNPKLKAESEKLIKYFFAALTLPEKDVWVNLSPYEKDRIVPKATGETEMGRDMLAQDYILKQITASLIYPEKGLGKEFWNKVYSEATERFGTTQIPVNTFNKVWIVADKASVYEAKDTVIVVDSHLKVMLEEDYLATQKHQMPTQSTIGSQIVRQIVLPALEKEVNEGKNFANLRQIFHSLILAKWYKETLKTALLNQVYSNQNKVGGLAFEKTAFADPQYIYQQYLKAYKKGVFNYIKEDIDAISKEPMPRKYFSGGVATLKNLKLTHVGPDEAMSSLKSTITGLLFSVGSLVRSASGIKDSGNLRPTMQIDLEERQLASEDIPLLAAVVEGKWLDFSGLKRFLSAETLKKIESGKIPAGKEMKLEDRIGLAIDPQIFDQDSLGFFQMRLPYHGAIVTEREFIDLLTEIIHVRDPQLKKEAKEAVKKLIRARVGRLSSDSAMISKAIVLEQPDEVSFKGEKIKLIFHRDGNIQLGIHNEKYLGTIASGWRYGDLFILVSGKRDSTVVKYGTSGGQLLLWSQDTGKFRKITYSEISNYLRFNTKAKDFHITFGSVSDNNTLIDNVTGVQVKENILTLKNSYGDGVSINLQDIRAYFSEERKEYSLQPYEATPYLAAAAEAPRTFTLYQKKSYAATVIIRRINGQGLFYLTVPADAGSPDTLPSDEILNKKWLESKPSDWKKLSAPSALVKTGVLRLSPATTAGAFYFSNQEPKKGNWWIDRRDLAYASAAMTAKVDLNGKQAAAYYVRSLVEDIKNDLYGVEQVKPAVSKESGKALAGWSRFHLIHLEKRMQGKKFINLGNDALSELVSYVAEQYPALNIQQYKGEGGKGLFPYLVWQSESHDTDLMVKRAALEWVSDKELKIALAEKAANAAMVSLGEELALEINGQSFLTVEVINRVIEVFSHLQGKVITLPYSEKLDRVYDDFVKFDHAKFRDSHYQRNLDDIVLQWSMDILGGHHTALVLTAEGLRSSITQLLKEDRQNHTALAEEFIEAAITELNKNTRTPIVYDDHAKAGVNIFRSAVIETISAPLEGSKTIKIDPKLAVILKFNAISLGVVNKKIVLFFKNGDYRGKRMISYGPYQSGEIGTRDYPIEFDGPDGKKVTVATIYWEDNRIKLTKATAEAVSVKQGAGILMDGNIGEVLRVDGVLVEPLDKGFFGIRSEALREHDVPRGKLRRVKQIAGQGKMLNFGDVDEHGIVEIEGYSESREPLTVQITDKAMSAEAAQASQEDPLEKANAWARVFTGHEWDQLQNKTYAVGGLEYPAAHVLATWKFLQAQISPALIINQPKHVSFIKRFNPFAKQVSSLSPSPNGRYEANAWDLNLLPDGPSYSPAILVQTAKELAVEVGLQFEPENSEEITLENLPKFYLTPEKSQDVDKLFNEASVKMIALLKEKQKELAEKLGVVVGSSGGHGHIFRVPHTDTPKAVQTERPQSSPAKSGAEDTLAKINAAFKNNALETGHAVTEPEGQPAPEPSAVVAPPDNRLKSTTHLRTKVNTVTIVAVGQEAEMINQSNKPVVIALRKNMARHSFFFNIDHKGSPAAFQTTAESLEKDPEAFQAAVAGRMLFVKDGTDLKIYKVSADNELVALDVDGIRPIRELVEGVQGLEKNIPLKVQGGVIAGVQRIELRTNGQAKLYFTPEGSKTERQFEIPIRESHRELFGTDMAMGSDQQAFPGGIDLNASKLSMHKTGTGIAIRFDPALIAQFKTGRFNGIVPVIISITPIVNIYPLLGLKEPEPGENTAV